MSSPGIVWIASYPKSGNTWIRCLITSLQADGAAIVLDSLGKSLPNAAARIWLESWVDLASEDLTADELHSLRREAHRRCGLRQRQLLKVHDCYAPDLFPEELTQRVVYIVRDPRDVAPSWADHMQVDLDTAIAKMADPGLTMSSSVSAYRPQARQHFGSWSGHVASWLDRAPGPCLLLRYEALLADPLHETMRLAEFLGLPVRQGAVARAVQSCRFDTLRQAEAQGGFIERNKGQQRFFRQGRAGTWQTTLHAGQVARLIADHGTTMQRLGYDIGTATVG